MERIHLNLVPFNTNFDSEPVANMMLKMGYVVNVIEGDTWVKSKAGRNNEISILLLDSEIAEVDGLRERMNEEQRPFSLAIVDNKIDTKAINIYELCDDFTTWPCLERELACRLEHLSDTARGGKCSDAEQAYNIEQFPHLNLIGESSKFKSTLKLIKKLSDYEASVLIEGETGTGKEVTARAIHYLSERRDNPFVPVNCGAIPDSLLENELFGHEKGAYTDAKHSQVGLIAEANGGTLFLDEIDSLSLKAQVTLLRFLQDKVYRPLGAKEFRRADVRIIAATNADMQNIIREGCFREDLYFRINILNLNLPSLRERTGDIRLLADKFMEDCRQIYSQKDKHLSEKTLRWLEKYSWPGNIRELENTIHRMFLLSDHDEIEANNRKDNPRTERRKNNYDRRENDVYNLCFSEAKRKIIEEFERNYLSWIITKTRGNVSKAARIIGKERRALGKLLKKYDIRYTE